MNKLKTLPDQTLTAIEQPTTGIKESIQPILDDVHMPHSAIRLEWIDATGQKVYKTAQETDSFL